MNRVDRNKSLVRYMKSVGVVLNQKDLAQKMGYNETYFSQILNLGTPEPKDFVKKLLILLPCLNVNWLLTGEGEMLIKDGSVEQNNIVGDNINGHNVTVGKSGDDYMKVIMQQSLQLSKSQEQIDRLITLLEKMSDKKE